MSELRFNTIAGTFLASVLVVLGVRTIVDGMFKPKELEKPGYEVDISAMTEAAGGEGAAEEDAPVDWANVLVATGAAEAGAKVAAKCKSCHDFTKGGPNETGPNLYGVVDRMPATHGGFAYSAALKGQKEPWTYERLYHFLARPSKFVPGTAMSFVGLKNPEDREHIIAYLRTLADTPAPLPPPLPPQPEKSAEGAPEAAPGAAAPADTRATPDAGAPAEAPAQP